MRQVFSENKISWQLLSNRRVCKFFPTFTISSVFLILWVIFFYLDPDPDAESGIGLTDSTVSGSYMDPNKKHYCKEICVIFITEMENTVNGPTHTCPLKKLKNHFIGYRMCYIEPVQFVLLHLLTGSYNEVFCVVLLFLRLNSVL